MSGRTFRFFRNTAIQIKSRIIIRQSVALLCVVTVVFTSGCVYLRRRK